MSVLQMPPKHESHAGILIKLAFTVPFGIPFGGTLGGTKMQLNYHPSVPRWQTDTKNSQMSTKSN